jgi:aspartate/methionine/tyrosine aminotransferase
VFSSRVGSELSPNRLTRALEDLRRRGTPYLDLTESNPTRTGFDYPADLLGALAGPASLVYRPEPLGLRSAREAVCRELTRRGTSTTSERVVLTASTSEAYSFLFKLLCDPGDSVLVPRPGYPLFEHLTRLDGVVPVPYLLELERRWTLDVAALERAATPRTRALLVVSPNNPTGTVLSGEELVRASAFCEERSIALIGDEVFLDYRFGAEGPRSVVDQDRALAFSLGGLSKSAGLPQLKLAWIAVSGPSARVSEALARLEVIADAYLSVSTPVQEAAAVLLEKAPVVRRQIQERIESNLACLRSTAASFPSCEVLEPEGGWSAVIRVPAVLAEEELAVRLLNEAGVLVHPGYFFDFPHEAFVVVSLLPMRDVFVEGISRLLELAGG